MWMGKGLRKGRFWLKYKTCWTELFAKNYVMQEGHEGVILRKVPEMQTEAKDNM